MLVGLEVNVRCAHAERVEQHLVQEAHYRRIFDLGNGLLVCVACIRADFVELELGADDAVDGFGCTHRRRFDHARQLVVLGDHPVHAHLRSKLDLLDRLLVRRICRCDDQPIVALAQNDDAVGLAQLLIEQVLGKALEVDGVEIEQWGAECARKGVRQVGGRHRAGASQLCDETATTALGLLVDLLGRLRCEFAGRDQRARQPGQSDLRILFSEGFGGGHPANVTIREKLFTIIPDRLRAVNHRAATDRVAIGNTDQKGWSG